MVNTRSKTVDWGGLKLSVNEIEIGVTKPGRVGTGSVLSGTELAFLDSVTAGTSAASKALVLDANEELNWTYTSASTSGSTSVEPLNLDTTMTGAGGVGGRAKFTLTTNVALGSWSNALKGEVTYGASGRTAGLGSAICAEMTLSAGTSAGTYSPIEVELNMGAGALTGTLTSLYHASVNGAAAGTFDDNGYVINLQGLTAGAAHVFRTGLTGATVVGDMTAALRIKIGATDYFIPLATAA